MLREFESIGPYTLVRPLGRGAFGVVWLAERRTAIATTEFALKIILDAEPDLDSVRHEASLWRQAAGHPNVLPIIEADIYDGQVVIVSEYAPDGPLNVWLKRNGGAAPSIGSAVEMVSGILSGLEHLHARRIIHRDLKPANILLQGSMPRLADFGIARVLKTTSYSATVAGTPSYMAPEAFDGKRSEKTDIWAAGIIFYELLTGRLPFAQTDMMALMAAIMTRSHEPFSPSVPQSIQAVVERALQKDPQERFKSAAEMLSALRASYAPQVMTTQFYRAEPPIDTDGPSPIAPLPVEQTTVVASSAPLPPPRPATSTSARLVKPPPPSRRGVQVWAIVVALAVTVIVVGLLVKTWRRSDSATSQPEQVSSPSLVSSQTPEISAASQKPASHEGTDEKPTAVQPKPDKVTASLRVTDPQGAMIGGAQVTLAAGGRTFEKVTNARGSVSFSQVPCGGNIRTEIVASAPWSKLIINDYLECKSQSVSLGTFNLPIGSSEKTVTIRGPHLRRTN